MKRIMVWIFAIGFLGLASVNASLEEKANLDNVTNGNEIRWIVTSNDSLWYASASFKDGEFMLTAEFSGLTDPLNDDFYEGWLVQKTPFKFISTWELTMIGGKYVNNFSSTTDYSTYTEYVLTIEPNDGNDAPADHIFEGMVMLHNGEIMKDSMMDKKEDMMKKDDMTDDTMAMKKKAMMDRKASIKGKIKARVPNLSKSKVAIILERVKKLRMKLDTLNITAEKRASYDEILDVFVEVLQEGNMMMDDTMMK